MINAKATQEFVPIKEIRDGVVILKDGGLRAILIASSINLSLKSYDEQKAILGQFQAFLNSLDFSTQIVIQSRRYDIKPYLAILENRLPQIEEPLMKMQTREYIEFIRTFTDKVNIMTKRFFIVVPYTAPVIGSTNPVKFLSFGKKGGEALGEQSFEEKRTQLEQRISLVEGGLSGIGVRAVKLGTEEVIELFYKTFNPGEGAHMSKT